MNKTNIKSQCSFQLLVSTMNKSNYELERMLHSNNISCNSLIINQCNHNILDSNNICEKKKNVISLNEFGLSLSRNIAIENSEADICLFADDDISYIDNFAQLITNEFEKYPAYDIIIFYINRSPRFVQKRIGRKKRINMISSLGIISSQIAFRRKSIVDANIRFDIQFGSGSNHYMCGEENIFLIDCLKKGMKILYIPLVIGTMDDSDSSWFKGFDENYFVSKGAIFHRLFPIFGFVLIGTYALVKYNEYKGDINISNSVKQMIKGYREHSKDI
ncbi:glycosyltransferase family A protein [Anaerorhabdus furcosa]|uniref:Glycosyl transferase family 2 n=1 Tax=Anaerorhabdus furcosa TaxID=118967 RepID=A0A1T4LQS3_9FIRM|nr:glycosyltransferase family A protein [Anaerorhabdus furcosa]SJZ56784.1 hypothetical protein SAMN02745191_0998 [Anaerorhabdus furcosa]